MTDTGPVIVTAAGESSRIRSMMNDRGFPGDYPKHLLPTGGPGGETLLGRILRQASALPNSQLPIVYVTETSLAYMQAHPDIGPAKYRTEKFGFSMDPIYYQLRRTGSRVLGCAGDFYSDFSWSSFLAEHEQSNQPVSVLAGNACGSEDAAIFEISNQGVVTGFSRPTISGPDDYRNIGAYIIDYDSKVSAVMDELLPENPALAPDGDAVFCRMVSLGLVGAVTSVGTQHYNINVAAEYEIMLSSLSAHSEAKIRQS